MITRGGSCDIEVTPKAAPVCAHEAALDSLSLTVPGSTSQSSRVAQVVFGQKGWPWSPR